jgi:hypothetical protein
MNEQIKVDFMIIGAQKCGTSSLAFQMAQHPQICFCKKKEPHYFSRVENWQERLQEYHLLFSPSEGQLCGEASTSYTSLPSYPNMHRRLYEYNPDLKLIYIIRQPVERIVSHYSHRHLRGRHKDPPEIDIWMDQAYINTSRYGVQIRPYIELFSLQNILILISEEVIRKPHDALKQIAGFLNISVEGVAGIDVSPQNVSLSNLYLKNYPGARLLRALFNRSPLPASAWERWVYNKYSAKREFPESLRRTLWRFLEDDVSYIETLLQRRLDVWRKGYSE